MSISEVAAIAGVSKATISRVINNKGGVSGRTAENVRRIMRDIGYVPSPNRPGRRRVAKEANKQTQVLFLVVSNNSVTQLFGFQKLMAGVSAEMKTHDVKLFVEFVSSIDEARSFKVSRANVDGLLIHLRTPFEPLGEAFTHLPTVWLMSNPVRPPWGDQVMPDSDGIGLVAAQYLVGAGRRRLAYLDLTSGHWATQLRARPFQEAAESLGAEADTVTMPPSIAERFGIEAFDLVQSGKLAQAADHLIGHLLDKHPRVDGVCFASDSHAALLMPALQRRGVDVSPGGDIEAVSCDNERTFMLGLHPCPPTIDIHVEAIGRRGAAQLLWRIAEGSNETQTRISVVPSLVMPDVQET